MNITSIAPRLWGRRPGKTLAILAMALFMGLAWTTTSHAETAANTIIRNVVTVFYSNADGTEASLTDEVTFTVSLVDTTPTLGLVSLNPQDTDASTTVRYDYTLTSMANGPDEYTISEVSLVQTNITSSNVSISVGTLILGATTSASPTDVNIAGTGETTITVPSDGSNDSQVNGIIAGDVVVIDGNTYVVFGIEDTYEDPTSTITLTADGTPAVLSYGEIIGEQQSFFIEVSPGTVTDIALPATIEVTIGAVDIAPSALQTTHMTTTNVIGIQLIVTKYVRNATTNEAGTGTVYTVDGENYYLTGVSGAPGDYMEYLIRIENIGSGMATNLVIVDAIPQFTTYRVGYMAVDPDGSGFATIDEGHNTVDAGEYDLSTRTVYIYAGTDGADDGPAIGEGNGGYLIGGTTTFGRFQVTIDDN